MVVDNDNRFSFDTINDFDEHIEKSIPNYRVLTSSIKSMSEYFMVEGQMIYDLGCSTGKLLKELQTKCHKIGVDNSNLLPKEETSEVSFVNVDLNQNKYIIKNACLVYSIFTMQFLNPSSRQKYIESIYEGLNSGGAFIICEKSYREYGKLQEIMSFSHYDYKLKNFKAEEIIKKENDLRFIMKPNTEKELETMLNKAGFESYKITKFWQFYNFVGYIALK